MLTVDEGQQHPKDVLDPVVHEKAFFGVSQCNCDGAIPEDIFGNRRQESGYMAFCRRNHICVLENGSDAGLQDDLVFGPISRVVGQEIAFAGSWDISPMPR